MGVNYLSVKRDTQPSSQQFGVDMNINYVVTLINFLFTKIYFFRNTKDFLIPCINYISRIWNFGSPMLLNFYSFWLHNYFDLSVTDESYKDETRVWRIKL